MDAERWQRLSPLLDALFELEPDERARRLEVMRAEDPAQADELQALVALEEASGDFLSEPLVAPLPGARVGALIGPYRLERLLGEGGMGQVWLASRADGMYQRRVALKLLRPGLVDPGLRLRFQREREILARLAHPHIARLLYAGLSDDSQPFLVLEYIEGEPVTDWCEARDVPIVARLELFSQVCAAVSHAHANLIVHRDLKPSNILVTATGDVQLLDFGIAKLLDTSEGTAPEYTGTGMRAFTLHYAAPEQIRGELVTTMTDVYALGVVLYELLAGAKPYTPARGSDAAWEEAILSSDPLPPSQALARAAEANPAGRARCAGAPARSPATWTTSCSRRWPRSPCSATRPWRRWRATCSGTSRASRCSPSRAASATGCRSSLPAIAGRWRAPRWSGWPWSRHWPWCSGRRAWRCRTRRGRRRCNRSSSACSSRPARRPRTPRWNCAACCRRASSAATANCPTSRSRVRNCWDWAHA